MSHRSREDRILAYVLLLPALAIILTVTLYPLIRSFWISLHGWNLTKPNEGHPFLGWSNYQYVLTDPKFWESFRITLIFVIAAVAFEVILAIGIALLLNREFRGRTIVRVIAVIPWAIPSIVNGIMWKWIFNPSYGALNGLLYSLHIIDKYIIWLGYPNTAMAAIVWADVWKETPFLMLLILAALQTIPKELYEACRLDGANSVQSFFNLTLPLIQPVLFVAVALRTIWALKSFDLIYTLTAGGPSSSTSVVGYYIYLKTFISLQFGRGAAAAYIVTIVIMIIVILYQKFLYREVKY